MVAKQPKVEVSREQFLRPGNIEIQNVAVEFGAGDKSVLAIESASLDVRAGEFVSVLGPSGCGKSTILNVVAGFVRPTRGRVLLDGLPIIAPGADRGVVFQQPALFPWKTVRQNVMLGPQAAGRSRGEASETARQFMAMVGLTEFADHYPETLSGGMQQRVGIARALANKPAVLLMDEPFGALDAQTRQLMQEGLLRIWEELHTTLLFVTHDIEEAIFLADRVILMSARPGRILADIRVPISRPRREEEVLHPEFLAIKKRCRELIRTESVRAFDQFKKIESER
jgi:NitT/TauT family transport system ATP-binding protein